MAQGDSEIAFHSSPVFLNSKKRLGNGGRFDQLNFFLNQNSTSPLHAPLKLQVPRERIDY